MITQSKIYRIVWVTDIRANIGIQALRPKQYNNWQIPIK